MADNIRDADVLDAQWVAAIQDAAAAGGILIPMALQRFGGDRCPPPARL